MPKETEKPFGYLLIDNQPKTTSDKQVVADVFGNSQSYPHVTTGKVHLKRDHGLLGSQKSNTKDQTNLPRSPKYLESAK